SLMSPLRYAKETVGLQAGIAGNWNRFIENTNESASRNKPSGHYHNQIYGQRTYCTQAIH
ncbi:MAG: hypothetical protein ACK43N_18205, partial [Pirellulaceae bacterium]